MDIYFQIKDNALIVDDIKAFIRRGKPVRSNYYGIDQTAINEICELKHSIIIKQVNKGFCRLYFMTFDENELVDALNSLSETIYVFNVPVRNDLGTWQYFLDRLYFRKYSTYYRYNNKNIKGGLKLLESFACEDETIENKGYRLCVNAGLENLEEIYKLLYDNFDVYSDYLPSLSSLHKIISDGGVYVNKSPDGLITGVIVFVYTGKKCYQNFWIDKSELGLYLMRKLYEKMNEDQIVLTNFWVADWNKSVIKLHRMLGALPDNLIDYTYIKYNDN